MIEQILKQLVLGGMELYSKVCTVESVNGLTCTCTPVDDDAQLLDVRLAADPNASTYFAPIPKVGSSVIVSFLNKDLAFVTMVCDVDRVEVKIDTMKVVINEKMEISKGEDSLSKILTDLIAEINKIVVLVGTTPNVAALLAIDARQKQFLSNAT